jgi:hypothetical protein
MLELLNQLDGFDAHVDVKVIPVASSYSSVQLHNTAACRLPLFVRLEGRLIAVAQRTPLVFVAAITRNPACPLPTAVCTGHYGYE